MPDALVVPEGTEVRLSEEPPPNLADALRRFELGRLRDLAEFGFVSPESLNDMFESAKEVTARALTEPATFHPFVPIPGTGRPDLRRYGAFLAMTSAGGHEVGMFWRRFRAIPPAAVDKLTLDTPVSDLPFVPRVGKIVGFAFEDITIEPFGALVTEPAIEWMGCRDLLIRRGGNLRIESHDFRLRAASVQGEQ